MQSLLGIETLPSVSKAWLHLRTDPLCAQRYFDLVPSGCCEVSRGGVEGGAIVSFLL